MKDSYLMPVLRAVLCLMNGDPEFPEANPFHPILVDIIFLSSFGRKILYLLPIQSIILLNQAL